VIESWSYRWAAEIFHEFGKQVTGLEAAQVRKEEAVKRHFRLSCVAQSLLQQTPASGSTTERFAFAQGDITIGQRVRTSNSRRPVKPRIRKAFPLVFS